MKYSVDDTACHKQAKQKANGRRIFATFLAKIKALRSTLKYSKQIANERRTLSYLTDHQLRDIGLSRDQVESECGRSYFDTPLARYDQ